MLNIIMLGVAMLNVVILSVMAPFFLAEFVISIQHFFSLDNYNGLIGSSRANVIKLFTAVS